MHSDNCPSRYQVERDADRDYGTYGADYRRYYDGCSDAERWHRDEMRRQEEEHAEKRAAERQAEERREEEYWRQQEEEHYASQQAEQEQQNGSK